jgi:hypothetical protein
MSDTRDLGLSSVGRAVYIDVDCDVMSFRLIPSVGKNQRLAFRDMIYRTTYRVAIVNSSFSTCNRRKCCFVRLLVGFAS